MTTRRLGRRTAGLGACFALVLAAAPNRAADPKSDPKWETNRTTHPEDLAELKALQARVKVVVDKCTPTTVAITITSGFAVGAGSGVIVSEDGLVLTAAHVIAGESGTKGGPASYEAGKECTIVLADGKRVKAKTLGINDRMDSGMVKIVDKGPNDGKWPFSPVAKSADLLKQQWVVSLGHPGGPKSGRAPVARLGRIENNTKDIVRSNCTLVGGDSGGPLFDLDGNVVGIHSRIGLTLAQNIHVPTDRFKAEWDKLVAGEVIGRPQKTSGAVVGVVFPEDENDDAWVSEVDDEGPAAKAGVKPGDTITKVNADGVKSVKQFRDLLKDKKPGETVKLTVRRGVEILTLPVTLGKRAL
jgi:serine protease Do